MARRSKLEDLVLSWFPKEKIVLNSRKLLPSKQEIDIYFPRYGIGIEINGGIWHSEAMGKTKFHHRDKFIEARKSGINLLSFSDFEVNNHPQIIKSIILREMFKSYNLQYRFTKICIPSHEDRHKFYVENSLIHCDENTHSLSISDKKGIAASWKFSILDEHIVMVDYTERNGLHIINGVSKLCDEVRNDFPDKLMFVKLENDHGYLYYMTLRDNGYKELCVTEPNFYYLKGNIRLRSNTKEDTEGFTRVYNSGEVIFIPVDQDLDKSIEIVNSNP